MCKVECRRYTSKTNFIEYKFSNGCITSAKIQICVSLPLFPTSSIVLYLISAGEQERWILSEKATSLLNLMTCQKDGQVCHMIQPGPQVLLCSLMHWMCLLGAIFVILYKTSHLTVEIIDKIIINSVSVRL